MRLLLDAHISGPRVGRRLQAAGHDVRALDQEPALEALADQEVLALAAAEQRILVTHNIRDFAPIMRDWAQTGQSHAGIILIYGISQHEFDLVVRGIQALLQGRASEDEWRDYPAVLDRDLASRSGTH